MANLEDSFPKKIHTIIKVDLDDLKKLDDLVDKVNAEAEINKQVEENTRSIVSLLEVSNIQAKLLEKIVANITEGG